MQNGGGGEADAEDVKAAAPAKRVRRPNVRLHQPYYEDPGGRTLLQQWKDLEGPRKPRTHRALNVKSSKKIKGCNNREGMKQLNFDDDVAIGSWTNLNRGKRDRDSKSKSKRKRIKPPNSKKRLSVESHENEDFAISSDGDGEKQVELEQEEHLDANGTNFEPEDSDQYNSFGNEKLIDDDDNNVVGVGAWLNELGLGKYAALFEVHEVDDEVLPYLTLEDLKDMGISAVGSRRKMYCSIQKLGKRFS